MARGPCWPGRGPCPTAHRRPARQPGACSLRLEQGLRAQDGGSPADRTTLGLGEHSLGAGHGERAAHTQACTQFTWLPTTVPRCSQLPGFRRDTTGRGNKCPVPPAFRARCWSLLRQPPPGPPHCPVARHGDVRRLQAQPGSKHAHCPATPQHTWPRRATTDHSGSFWDPSQERRPFGDTGPGFCQSPLQKPWKEANRDPHPPRAV